MKEPLDSYYKQILIDTKSFSDFPDYIRNNKNYIKLFLTVKGFIIQLKHISQDLKEDKNFFKELIEINFLSLAYASETLKEDKELIYLSLTMDGQFIGINILDFIPVELKKTYHNNLDQLKKDIETEKFKNNLELNLVDRDITKKNKI